LKSDPGIRIQGAALFILLVLCQGCRGNTEEAEKMILAHDPSFRVQLERRAQLQNELDSSKLEYIDSKAALDEKITAVNEKKKELKLAYRARSDEIKRRIDPERRRLEHELLETERDYKDAKRELKNTERDIKEIEDLMSKKDKLILTSEEIQAWNERLSSSLKKKSLLASEIDKLEEEVRITKLKLAVLKLK